MTQRRHPLAARHLPFVLHAPGAAVIPMAPRDCGATGVVMVSQFVWELLCKLPSALAQLFGHGKAR
jgi:hypothetical protein